MAKSSTLIRLLHLTWSSPIFGDSFPKMMPSRMASILSQVEEIYGRFIATLHPVLTHGMPNASPDDVAEFMRQIAPKSTAFCPAISAGEVSDINRLKSAAVSIALVYWADHSMDRGDEAMLMAVRMVTNTAKPKFLTAPLSPKINARVGALRMIEKEIAHVSCPEDVPLLAQSVYHTTLSYEAHLRELSRHYMLEGGGPAFWEAHKESITHYSISDVAILYVASLLYSLYRRQQPELPSVGEIFDQPDIIEDVGTACCAAIRVWDDLGDRLIDSGDDPDWGLFNLNLFNQPNPIWLRHFLRQSGITDAQVIETAVAAFQAGTPVSRNYIVQIYKNLVSERMANLSSATWERYGLFLKLCKRVTEAGYVNAMGDIELAGTRPLQPQEAVSRVARSMVELVEG